MENAVALSAKAGVLQGMYVGDVNPFAWYEGVETVGGERVRSKKCAEIQCVE